MDGDLSAAALAAHQGFGLVPEDVAPLSGGTTHRTFRLRCGGRPLFLKGYALEHLGRAETEARLLLHLASHPSPLVRTPVPLLGQDGEAVYRSRGRPEGPVVWILTSWLDGEQRTWRQFTKEDWRALGAALAGLHEALARLPGLPGAARLVDRLRAIDPGQEQDRLVEHAMQVLRRRGAPAEARRYFAGRQHLLEVAAARLADLRHSAPEQILHNDFNQYNFLFCDDRAPPGVLDWERACLGPAAYEVVRCINVACLAYPARATAFLHAYRERRPLDSAALCLATTAFLLEQAVKGWPVAAWLDGREGAGHLEGQFQIVALLSGGLPAFDRFYGRSG